MITQDQIASPGYRDVLKQRYTMPGWGASGHSHAPVVDSFAREVGATSILDYGCGRGTLKKVMPRFDVREYDPGIIGKDMLPEPADLVVSTDVLEHIEPELLDNVLAHLKGLARKGLFLNIATGPAREILPDGRNAHLIQQPMDWWIKRLQDAGLRPKRTQERKGVSVWIKVDHG